MAGNCSRSPWRRCLLGGNAYRHPWAWPWRCNSPGSKASPCAGAPRSWPSSAVSPPRAGRRAGRAERRPPAGPRLGRSGPESRPLYRGLRCPQEGSGSGAAGAASARVRSEERRVGKECRSRVLKQMYVLSSCCGGGSEGPRAGGPWCGGGYQPVTSRRPSFSCSPFNDRPMCRICHEGSSQEDLLSPCTRTQSP